jgi:hypothetical protein
MLATPKRSGQIRNTQVKEELIKPSGMVSLEAHSPHGISHCMPLCRCPYWDLLMASQPYFYFDLGFLCSDRNPYTSGTYADTFLSQAVTSKRSPTPIHMARYSKAT